MRQAGIWLSRVKHEMGDDLDLTYRSFALEQINSDNGPDWKAWEQGEDYESRGLWSLRGGIAARMQGYDAHDKYMLELQHFKFVERGDIRDRQPIVEAAERAGLDMEKFESDLDSPDRLAEIGRDHEEAIEKGIFRHAYVHIRGRIGSIPEDLYAARRGFVGRIRKSHDDGAQPPVFW